MCFIRMCFHILTILMWMIFTATYFQGTEAEIRDNATKIICYLTNWSFKRNGTAQFKVSDIPENTCTHVIYSFAVLNPKSLIMEMSDPQLDIELYKEVTWSLKSKGIKVMLALGGWADSENSSKYSEMINDGFKRTNFVHSSVFFLRQHNFDGLDFDWEFPRCWWANCTLGPISDKYNFANLLTELRVAFKFYGLLLSVAVSADLGVTNEAYNMHQLAEAVDWIGVMTYDYHKQGKTSNHAPYMGPHPNTVDSLDFWINKGIPSNKIVMGIPLYGRSYTLVDTSMHGIGAPAKIGNPAPYTQEPGYIAYFELCVGWNYSQIPGRQSYAVKGDQWVSYDNVNFIKQKIEHVKQYNLGGAMVWAIDLDDFNGLFCGEGKYPLMTAIKSVL